MKQKLDSRPGSPAVKSNMLFTNNQYSFNKHALNVYVVGIQTKTPALLGLEYNGERDNKR